MVEYCKETFIRLLYFPNYFGMILVYYSGIFQSKQNMHFYLKLLFRSQAGTDWCNIRKTKTLFFSSVPLCLFYNSSALSEFQVSTVST